MLEGKVAIITGGTRGIGFETAKLFVKHKAKVIIFGSKRESVQKALSKLPGITGSYPNLNDFNEVSKVIDAIYKKYGHIDILVNNAGVSAQKKIEDTSEEEFKNVCPSSSKSKLPLNP